jgi:hypothetical protein
VALFAILPKGKRSRVLVQAKVFPIADNAAQRRPNPKEDHMQIAYLAISASICLIAALIEAWLLVVAFSSENGPLNRLLPNGKDLLRSHVDYLMMALFLFVFYGLFRLLRVAPPDWLVASACLGAFFNPSAFLVRGVKPSYQKAPPIAFLLMLITSCIATTVGFGAAAWTISTAALAQ